MIELPKYVRMRVSGSLLHLKDCKDIIFRTDPFFTDSVKCPFSGPEEQFITLYQKAAGLYCEGLDNSFDLQRRVRENNGFVYTKYVKNDFGLSYSLDGPFGWCHYNGKIFFDDDIWKNPSVFEVIDDWSKIAIAFPYLDLVATLFSGSVTNDIVEPIVDIIVKDGKVNVEKVTSLENHERFYNEKLKIPIMPYNQQLGVPLEWYTEFAIKVRESLGLDVDWDAIREMNDFLAECWSQSSSIHIANTDY